LKTTTKRGLGVGISVKDLEQASTALVSEKQRSEASGLIKSSVGLISSGGKQPQY